MTRKIALTSLLSLCISASSFGQTLHSNVHLGFAYPLSTNGTQAPQYNNTFSAHAISGVSYSETAFCGSGIASIVKDSVRGFIGSGIVNVIGNKATGVQAAGMVNIVRNQTEGLQAAGFANISGCVTGAQTAGFANVATGNVYGAQIAGFSNTAHNASAQIAGFVNVADTNRSQIAGFINIGSETNAQVAGFVNVARNVRGSQVAGFINVANKVKGAQIGIINISDSCDYTVGLINLSKCGEKSIGVMMDETYTPFVTFRSGGRVVYGIVGGGYNGSDNRTIYALQLGMGAHLPISKAFRITGEATATWLTEFWDSNDLQAGLRVMPSLRVGVLEFYAGPSFNYAVSFNGTSPFDHHSTWSDTYRYHTHELYIGGVAGVQVHF
jgi:hypothetical protein